MRRRREAGLHDGARKDGEGSAKKQKRTVAKKGFSTDGHPDISLERPHSHSLSTSAAYYMACEKQNEN